MGAAYTIYCNNPEDFLGVWFYDWRKHVFEHLAERLSALGSPTAVEVRDWFEAYHPATGVERIRVRDSIGILQNLVTGEYHAMCCHDQLVPDDFDVLLDDPRCLTILKCQYRSKVFSAPRYEKVKAWTYFDRYWPTNEATIIGSRDVPRISEQLYFRGADWGVRGKILHELADRGVIDQDFEIIEYDRYFREKVSHRMMLSLPGVADLCNRDVECFGAGVCVLRPTLRTEMHDPLVPDYHYIAVDTRCSAVPPETVADRIEKRYREVADDRDLIEFVIGNAARWYDANVRIEPALKLTTALLGFDDTERRTNLEEAAHTDSASC